VINDTIDTKMVRDGAGIVALQNGTSAQTFRSYGTYTDASNYEGLQLTQDGAGGQVTIEAITGGTGADNIGIDLNVAGTGQIHSNTNQLHLSYNESAPCYIVGGSVGNGINIGGLGTVGDCSAAFGGGYGGATPYVRLAGDNELQWTNGNAVNNTRSLVLGRGAGNHDLAIHGAETNPANLFLYGSVDDHTAPVNYEGLKLSQDGAGGAATLAAITGGTGIDNIDVTLTPAGTGDINLGNFTLDGDQTVGVGEDNYVLTYDNASGLISLEASTGGSSTPAGSDTQVQYNDGGSMGASASFVYNGDPVAATGDEEVLTLSYTTNKLTSGNDTGLTVNWTDTASPGTSYPFMIKRNGAIKMWAYWDGDMQFRLANDSGSRIGWQNPSTGLFTGFQMQSGNEIRGYHNNTYSTAIQSSGFTVDTDSATDPGFHFTDFVFANTTRTSIVYEGSDGSPALGIRARGQSTNDAQTLNIYGTYTDSSNYEGLSFTQDGAGGAATLSAITGGTGGDNIDIDLTPAGTGEVNVNANLRATGALYFNGADSGFANGTGAAVDIRRAGTTQVRLTGSEMRIGSQPIGWGTGIGSEDLYLYRDAAAVLAVRNSTNAQTLRVYGTYTDASNYTRAALNDDGAGTVALTAETLGTGADNIGINLTPAGTGDVSVTSGNLSVAGDIHMSTDLTGIKDSNSNELLLFDRVASAVNYLQVANAATANGPSISALGSDTDIDVTIACKGNGDIILSGGSGTNVLPGGDLIHHLGGSSARWERVYCAGVNEEVHALSGTTPAINPANGAIKTWTLTGNSTPTDSLSAGDSCTLHILDGTSYTITWTMVDEWIGGSAPTLDTTNETIIALWKQGATVYGKEVGVSS
jgi:hypothetical protein